MLIYYIIDIFKYYNLKFIRCRNLRTISRTEKEFKEEGCKVSKYTCFMNGIDFRKHRQTALLGKGYRNSEKNFDLYKCNKYNALKRL